MNDLSFSCRWTLFFFALLGPLATAEEPNPWLIAPLVNRQISDVDQAARADLVALIVKHQDADFREHWGVDIPPRASGVPQDYTVLIYDSGYSERRIEVHVKAGRAKIELCDTDGIFRLERPAQTIDRLVRQLAYAFHSTERELKEVSSYSFFLSASHSPRPTIEVYSNNANARFHLKTPAWQAIGREVSRSTNGLQGYMHTRLYQELHLLAWKEGELISIEEENREILTRLGKVPVVETDEPDYSRRDLASVEAIVYGELAIKRRLAEAGADLKRLGCDKLAMQLEIATAADPTFHLQEAVLQSEREHHVGHWALQFAKDKRHPERLSSLLDLLPCVLNHYHVAEILECAAMRPLFPGQIEQIKRFYQQTGDQNAKISAARALLQLTHEEAYFEYLDQLVRVLPRGAKDDYRHPRRLAAGHLLEYASKTGKHRERACQLLKLLIGELEKLDKPDWSEIGRCADAAGSLATKADLHFVMPFLIAVAEDKSPSTAGNGILAMAKLDTDLGLEHLHRRIERNNRSNDENYGWEVYPFYELIMRERDRAAIPLLKQAWQVRVNHVPRDSDAKHFGPGFVIAYLEAKSVDERISAALTVCQNHYFLDEDARKKIAAQLVAEGGDPARCQQIVECKSIFERPPRGR